MAFWSGVGFSAIGGASAYLAKKAADDEKAGRIQAGDEARAWTGLMWGSFGTGLACLVTGVVLWALSPGDREWFESHQGGVALVPGRDSLVLSLGGRW